eukprot:12888387-Prorocentrum_lima.AAC.1
MKKKLLGMLGDDDAGANAEREEGAGETVIRDRKTPWSRSTQATSEAQSSTSESYPCDTWSHLDLGHSSQLPRSQNMAICEDTFGFAHAWFTPSHIQHITSSRQWEASVTDNA